MNQFGGDWTQQKIEIVVAYAKAYLTIMNKYPQFKCLYFDGFAGSGDIYKNDSTDIEIIKGVAIRILEIDFPKSFDMYYFVELDEMNRNELNKTINEKFPEKSKKSFVVQEDCNVKLVSMAVYLQKNKSFRVLAFIDPYGMSLNWSSIQVLKNLGIDLWILVPTGIGMNRLLTRDGNIKESWLKKLEMTLGMERSRIKEHFYKPKSVQTLFGEETFIEKEKNAIEKAGKLYQQQINEIFKYVSDSFPLINSTGSVMYHFMMASNNKAAFNIANDIIKPKKK
ncbi:MAG TPA: three-Cys-motif partner protein TcmP [Chitinophagaceae bacterium]|nr:three-Cys-motif partner protein TcmP [Chitinophagaceae bacterium]